MRTFLLALTVSLAAAVPASAGGTAAPGVPKPAGFSARVTNPWFPLTPGTSFVYRGVKDSQAARDIFTVTLRTKKIAGVPCVVVEDRLYLAGRLHERTTDWYTQDKKGNVWYFGESTAELDKNGRVVSTQGSWQAGRDGAQPGVFMPAHLAVAQSFRQEYYKGQAEDHFEVLSLARVVRVPYVSSSKALLTKEWTPLEPGVLDHKFYVRGIGEVLEEAVEGPRERLELVAVRKT